jgi:hypothetical protein
VYLWVLPTPRIAVAGGWDRITPAIAIEACLEGRNYRGNADHKTAARRQLVIAIRLFFEDTNSVSVYALAHAAWEVLDALCKHRGLTRFREEMSGANGLSEAEIKRIANYGRNFFKHAKEDPEAVLDDFADDRNDHVLLAATFDYGTLAASKPMEVQVFQLWYFAVHPEKAMRPAMDRIIEAGPRHR